MNAPQFGPMRRMTLVETGPKVSPAEFGLALADLHARPTFQSLCDAAAKVGTDALGPTWVTLLVRRTPDGPLQPTAHTGPGASPWPVAVPVIAPEQARALFNTLNGKAKLKPTVNDALGDAIEHGAASSLQLAVRPEHVCITPVIVEGLPLGVVLVLVRGENVPEEAVLALADHTATATRGQLLIERMRNQGDIDQATFLINRAAFDINAAREVTRARRYRRPLSLLVLSPADADDETLRRLGSDVMAVIRVVDILARLDDKRLVLLLPETERAGATILARRTEARNPGLRVTVAALPGDGPSLESLLATAMPRMDTPIARQQTELTADAQPTDARDSDTPLIDADEPQADEPQPTRTPGVNQSTSSERFTPQNGPRRNLRDAFPKFHQNRTDTGFRTSNSNRDW